MSWLPNGYFPIYIVNNHFTTVSLITLSLFVDLKDSVIMSLFFVFLGGGGVPGVLIIYFISPCYNLPRPNEVDVYIALAFKGNVQHHLFIMPYTKS